MGFKPWRLVHLVSRIGTPLLRLFGISDKTAVAKGVKAVEILEPLIPPDKGSPPGAP